MTTLGSNVVTLTDYAKSLDPNGSLARRINLLAQSNRIMDDMTWMEGNLPTGHRTTLITSLPTVVARLYNQGIAPSKDTGAQIEFPTAMFEARSQIDLDLANLSGNQTEFRLSKQKPFMEAMTQKLAYTVFYGSANSPEEFVGLATMFSSTSATNGQNIILGGGSQSDNSSIWLVCYGEQAVTGIYPKGSKAGLQHIPINPDGADGGSECFDSNGLRFRGLADLHKWHAGIAVEDWRYVVRIPNIDISTLIGNSSPPDLCLLMQHAIECIPNLAGVRPVFYMNRTVRRMLPVQGYNASKANLGIQPSLNQFGKPGTDFEFLGIPIRIVDQISNGETLVS